ncbi:hypothetical protein WOLCODRAFT_71360, partial [Wolfiporia cocos MD-104 SS10]
EAKRAETRICPVCDEAIPVRLLAKHSELEMARVEEIIQHIGSTEVLAEAEPDEGLTSRSRRTAVKVRKTSGRSKFGAVFASTSEVTLDEVDRLIRSLKGRRKQRYAKLRDLMREDEDEGWWGNRHDAHEGTTCPVCGQTVRGDVDVIEAHVDSCLAHVRIVGEQWDRRASGSGQADVELDIDVDGDTIESATAGVSFRVGTGFDIRDRTQQDVEDEVDVDGEDEAVFGAAQFSEKDIIVLSGNRQDEEEEVDVDNDVPATASVRGGASAEQTGASTLKDLPVNGKLARRQVEVVADVKRTMEEVMGVGEVEQVEQAIQKARSGGDNIALIKALESKVNFMVSTRVSSSTSSLCRICLDPYTEPTVSTGCWHTCCRECWLRCLGSTKLCPICKRITAAADLRRVYL